MAEIKEILPCIADPSKYRVIGRIYVKNLKEVAPYLARVLPNASYNVKDGWISFKKGQRIITIHSDGFVTMTMISEREEALSILKELEEKAKLAWEKRNEIDITKPLQKIFVGALDVYKYLPKTNCKECGEQTCMAFAVKLLNGEKDVKDCKPLFREKKYFGIRETLIGLLSVAGFEIEI
uniref:Fe-S protein n=1 Tax=Geoglobus ahangari TaxID=113653 RepID=A0A7C4S5J0_9EURY